MPEQGMNLHHARVEEQRIQMEEIARLGICPFCREHFESHHREPILFETSSWLVTENDYPYAGTVRHLLLVAIRHVTDMANLNFNEYRDLGLVLGWVSSNFPHHGGTLIMRFGDTDFTGATISHLHAHIIYGVSREEGTEAIKQKVGYQKK